MLPHKTLPFIAVVFLSAILVVPFASAGSPETQGQNAPAFVTMPGPGEKIPIGNDLYMIYGFVEKPKMGPVIMKIQVLNDKGEKDRSVVVTSESGMPSMPSMGTDHQAFRLSRKGDYLAPVSITMPGDWELKITVKRAGKIIYRGSYRFDV